MKDSMYWLAWQWIMPGMANRVREMVDHFGSPRQAWEAGEKALATAPHYRRDTPAKLAQRKAAVNPGELAERLHKMNINFLSCDQKEYPKLLNSIYDPPPAIFYKGQLKPADELAIAVVGARQPSQYGRLVTEKLTKDLGAVGVTVVSGMARGIDTHAHKGALAASARTIAVLGCGLDIVYPRENKKIMDQIVEAGAVVSEFPPGSPPNAWHFPARNRIISGLSLGTVVVEAGEKSGALITAGFALEQGRDVMAVPGNIVNTLSRGPHSLIKQGARLVEGAGDILDELGLDKLFPLPTPTEKPGLKMSQEEEHLYNTLSLEPISLESIIEKSGLPAQKAMAAMMYLELKGLTKQLPGKFYIRTGPS